MVSPGADRLGRDPIATSRYSDTIRHLSGQVRLTLAGLWAERITRAFWPVWSVLFVALGLVMLGAHEQAPIEALWATALALLAALIWALVSGIRQFRAPRRADAIDRLDAGLIGRPIQTLRDAQAIGHNDAASQAVWEAHQARMAKRAAEATAVPPDLRVSERDPFAFRYLATLLLAVALLFGSIWRVGTLDDAATTGSALASGPSWEGWVEPPLYTGLPTLYLADQPDALDLVEGSRVTLRLYGEIGALTVAETVSGRTSELPAASEPAQSFTISQSGEMRVDGTGGRSFAITILEDAPPMIEQPGDVEVAAFGEMTMPYRAQDDYGISGGEAVITLDLSAVDRRFGLSRDPEAREAITVPLPLPITGARDAFVENLVENFSEHPWSNLPVTFTLRVFDELEQASEPAVVTMPLPGRRFFDPLAASLIEQRRALLWTRENAADVAQVMRAVSYDPDDIFRSATAYLRMRTIQRRLETFAKHSMNTEQQNELARALWDLAVLIEDGDLNDAYERLQRAQDRLSEAMRNGASDQEIAELMQELREATDDYLRQLTQQAQRDAQQNGERPQQQQGGEQMQMTQNDLQEMMDRIQELMEQGRMAEAQEAMRQLQELMENMQVTQGQQGQGQQSPGEQAMEGLAETLREQQGLSDQAFRDLQEQFNPNAQQGESQGNEGRNGGQGRGQQHEGQDGQGQGDNQQGQQGGDGQAQGDQQGGDGGEPSLEQNLADRQQALRQELERQQGNLPGQGSEAGDAARRSLENAENAMRGAEDALRQDNLPEAIDRQADAMEALREGMRNLGEAMAQEQQGQGEQGNQQSAQNPTQNDPLGREPGSNGNMTSNESLLQGEDVYRRARELLDEIRRRTGDGDRPDVERDYLERLLDRF
ncbi:TIGR02302 family protein [Roseobacteraceae bacterium S113]